MAVRHGNEFSDIIEGCSPAARAQLARMLGEVFNTLENLDVICPIPKPPCHSYLKFEKLRRLYAALNNQLAKSSKCGER